MWILKRRTLVSFITMWSIVGFPLLALVTTAFEVTSTEISIVFRALAATAAMLLLLRGLRPRNHLAVILFATFWFFYFARLLLTTYFAADPLARPIEFYWIWSFGVCFLPALAVFFAFDLTTSERVRHFTVILTVFALALALIFGGTSFIRPDSTVADINRLNVVSLNPISMGHLGVSGALLGLCVLLPGRKKVSVWVLAVVALCLGGAVAILANSRGPLLAMAACIALLIFAGARRKRTYFLGAFFVALSVFLAINQQDRIASDTGLIWRFQAIFLGIDQSSLGRITAFEGAWRQFLASPFFGDAIEERVTGYYPHNVVLEAFMATGILGGLPFLVLILWSLRRAWTLVRQGSVHMWLGLLSVQYIFAGLFSGALYTSNAMWVTMALVLSLPLQSRLKQFDRVRLHPAPKSATPIGRRP